MSTLTNRGRYVDRQLIRRVGRPTLWEVADLCPNLREDGSHDPYCTGCVLTDRNYIYTTQAGTPRMIWHSDDRNEEYDATGSWEKGSARVTFPAHLGLGNQDRLTPQDDPIQDRLLLKRGAVANTADIIPSPAVVEILGVRDRDRAYTLDTDFTLKYNATTKQYSLLWSSSGVQPAVGARYSVRLMLRPVWIVMGHPKIRAFGRGKSKQLPKVVEVLRYDAAITADT